MRSKNRIRKIYKGYDKAQKAFKTEMIEAMQKNKAFAVAIAETWRAEQYSTQYWRTIEYFGFNHREAYKKFYNTGIPRKVLTGRDEFWLTVRFCGYEHIYQKYRKSIPQNKAFGLIFSIAIDVINNRKLMDRKRRM